MTRLLILIALLFAVPADGKPRCRDARGRYVTCPAPPPPAPPPVPVPPPPPVPTPPPPTPVPAAGYVLSPTLGGLPAIASTFDPMTKLVPSWGTGAIPPVADDVVGAFRFICQPGPLLRDDPILHPGQPGASHGHQFVCGNESVNAFSTYESLRKNSVGDSGSAPVNNSGYWQPWMEDGEGHIVQPDQTWIYYKRRPKSDPKCSLTSGDPQAQGNCVGLPNGLRFIFGWNPANPSTPKTGSAYFNCDGPGATQGHYPTITDAAPFCPPGSRLGTIISAPDCWDGRHLDTPDHRSHVSYPSYGSWGYLKCPPTHPYIIPGFMLANWFTVGPKGVGLWRLSSDHMLPGAKPGETFHADWFGAWDSIILAMWIDNCIDKKLNCSGGDLGNGKQIRGAAQPKYGWGVNPNRLVPIP